MAFGLSLLLVAGGFARAVLPHREVIMQGPPQARPSPNAIPAGVLTWRAGPIFHDRGVALLDVDGDGAKDLVGLAWRHGQDARPLHVVVIDRKTYAVKWRAGAYPAAWRDPSVELEVSGAGIVVTDGAGMSHLLDRRTGAELGAPTPSKVALAQRTSPKEDPNGCSADGSYPCTVHTDPALEAKLPALFRTHAFPIDYVADGDRITVVSISAPRGQAEQHALRWDDEGKKVMWKAVLVPAAAKNTRSSGSPEEWTAVADGRVYHLYQHTSGGFRISARDAKAGAVLYDVEVASLDEGSVVGELTADGDEAFIVANESLFVLDGATGNTKHRFRRF